MKLTGLPFVTLAAALELRHRDPRLETGAGLAALALAATASLVPLLRALSLVRAAW